MNNNLSAQDLKPILHSKRANLYYLEHCRILQKEGRILYLTETKQQSLYFNIPIANTTVLLLGTGTSITQAAVRMLAQAGVLIGFCGGGGTPLYMGCEIEWFTSRSEYRPTEYLQGWIQFWFHDELRLKAAKNLQQARIKFLQQVWQRDPELNRQGFEVNTPQLTKALTLYQDSLLQASSSSQLMLSEARLTKSLYQYAAIKIQQQEFKRQHQSNDQVNDFLNHGNYLAYGLAACTLWVLGIPHGFAVMHGKTRRGALVFDVADLIKDAIVLPWAFVCAKEKATEQEFRQQILQSFIEHHALEFMFNIVKKIALQQDEGQGQQDRPDLE